MTTPVSPTSPSGIKDLAELFNRLTLARPRYTSDISESASKRFSVLVQPRESKQGRPRRNTVASVLETNVARDAPLIDDEEDATDVGSLASFSRAESKKYPFEFKLPIHKLYPRAEWFQKVLDTLEDSKDRFKPLAEQIVYAGAKKNSENEEVVRKDHGAVRFKLVPVPPIPRRGRRTSVTNPHQGHIIGSESLGSGSPLKRRTLYRSPMPSSINLPLKGGEKVPPNSPIEDDGIRALKKRCVGRDKEMPHVVAAGALARPENAPRGTWVYNAAVSACESPTSANFITFPLAPPPSPASHTDGGEISLAAVSGHKRRVSECIPVMKTGYTITPSGQGPASSRLATGLRSSVADVEDGRCEILANQPLTHVMT